MYSNFIKFRYFNVGLSFSRLYHILSTKIVFFQIKPNALFKHEKQKFDDSNNFGKLNEI